MPRMHAMAPAIDTARQPYHLLREVLSGAVKYKTETGRELTQAVDKQKNHNVI